MTFLERLSHSGLGRLVALGALAVLLPAGARASFAQETPRVQAFGGYSYLRFDSSKIGFADDSNLNGANVSGSFNFTHLFGVTVDGGAHFGNGNSFYSVMGGPQFTFAAPGGTAFAHALFGLGKDRVNIGFGDSDRQFAWAVGGGYDYQVGPRFSIRVIQVDYLRSKLFDTSQNNIRASVGLVYHWGEVK